MERTRMPLVALAASLLFAVACGGGTAALLDEQAGGDPSPADAGALPDSGSPTRDSGTAADAGPNADAGARTDSGTAADASDPGFDAGTPPPRDGGTGSSGSLFSHMKVLHFGRSLAYLDSSIRSAAYDFFAAHVDVAEGQQDELKARNPNAKVFTYQLDMTACQHRDCSDKAEVDASLDALPEEFFLHFSEDTSLGFYSYQYGASAGGAEIPGCPAPGPATKACRVQNYVWEDSRYVFNPANAAFQAWMTGRLVSSASGIDGVFLDEHGPGFGAPLKFGEDTSLLSGGGVREYDGVGLGSGLDARYNAELSGALRVYSDALAAQGKFLFINTAGWALNSLCVDQAVAARGVHTEMLFRPDNWPDGAASFRQLLDLTRRVAEVGGMVDLVGSSCYWGPGGYTAGNFTSSARRYVMWRYAGHLVAKEPAGSAGIIYFDPDLCISNGLSFIDEWLPAYEVDVGPPVGDVVEMASGTAGCGYTVFAREYANAWVLVRPQGGWDCSDYGDGTAATVELPASLRPLAEDGTAGSPVSSIALRNAEAAILLK